MKKRSLIVRISAIAALLATSFFSAMGAGSAGEFANVWHSKDSAIVLDAYEYTPIDWSKIPNNKRLAGFINKASDGLAPSFDCGRNQLCRVKWRRYSAARELYHTRKILAKTLGLKWGAYHLARPGNPVEQAEHFLQFAEPGEDDLIALDIEHNDPHRWMSLEDAEIFAKHIKMRTGRYPVLYTNHTTSKFIAANRANLPLLSRLNLWYARYKGDIRGVFPMGNWKSYTFWQFSSMVNCDDKTCPWRIAGAGNWIDVNVVAMSPDKMRAAWPFAELQVKPEEKTPEPEIPVAAALPEPVQPVREPVVELSASEVDPIITGAVESAIPDTSTVDSVTTVSARGNADEINPIQTTFVVGHPFDRAIDPEAAKQMWVALAPVPVWRPGAKIVRRVSVTVRQRPAYETVVFETEMPRSQYVATGAI